jgi:hypothetical protein
LKREFRGNGRKGWNSGGKKEKETNDHTFSLRGFTLTVF